MKSNVFKQKNTETPDFDENRKSIFLTCRSKIIAPSIVTKYQCDSFRAVGSHSGRIAIRSLQMEIFTRFRADFRPWLAGCPFNCLPTVWSWRQSDRTTYNAILPLGTIKPTFRVSASVDHFLTKAWPQDWNLFFPCPRSRPERVFSATLSTPSSISAIGSEPNERHRPSQLSNQNRMNSRIWAQIGKTKQNKTNQQTTDALKQIWLPAFWKKDQNTHRLKRMFI